LVNTPEDKSTGANIGMNSSASQILLEKAKPNSVQNQQNCSLETDYDSIAI